MRQFSIRILLLWLAIIGVALAALVSPNQVWQSVVTTGLGAAILLMIMVAIGATGKLRIQSLSFVTVCLVIILLPTTTDKENIRFRMPLHHFIEIVKNSLGTHVPHTMSPQEQYVLFNSGRGTYMHHFNKRSSRSITKEAIEEKKLGPFVYDIRFIVNGDSLYSILTDFVTFGLGVLGFLVSGFVYDRRSTIVKD